MAWFRNDITWGHGGMSSGLWLLCSWHGLFDASHSRLDTQLLTPTPNSCGFIAQRKYCLLKQIWKLIVVLYLCDMLFSNDHLRNDLSHWLCHGVLRWKWLWMPPLFFSVSVFVCVCVWEEKIERQKWKSPAQLYTKGPLIPRFSACLPLWILHIICVNGVKAEQVPSPPHKLSFSSVRPALFTLLLYQFLLLGLAMYYVHGSVFWHEPVQR